MRPISRAISTSAALTAALAAPVALGGPAHAAAKPAQMGDFNGDGYADLAIGAPNGKVGGTTGGYVGIVYGSKAGAKTSHHQIISQNSAGVPGAAENGDRFGASLAAADFDGDGYSDLAIGSPGEIVNGSTAPGTVTIVFGSSKGLSSSAITIPRPATSPEASAFGTSLVAGEFNQDGHRDLAISAGAAVRVVYGRAGLRSSKPTLKDIPVGENLNALAAGDVTGDGHEDLVISSTEQDADLSTIAVYPGSASGLATTPLAAKGAGSAGAPIAVGDIDGNGNADVVVGGGFDTPGGDFTLYPGGPEGLDATRTTQWNQDSPGVPGGDEPGDRFGAAVAVRDVNGDGKADVLAGAPGEDNGTGAVTLLYGASTGLSTSGAQQFGQGSPGVPGTPEKGDAFGRTVTVIDLNHDGRAELVAAAPGENTGSGAVTILRATPKGATTSGATTFGPANLNASPAAADFGQALPAR